MKKCSLKYIVKRIEMILKAPSQINFEMRQNYMEFSSNLSKMSEKH